MAYQIATAAGCLDWVGRKETVMNDALLAEAKAHAEALHHIAVDLAGSRVTEIYGPDDPPTDETGKEVLHHG